MNKDERGEARRFLDEIRERLQRDLQALAARPSRGRVEISPNAARHRAERHPHRPPFARVGAKPIENTLNHVALLLPIGIAVWLLVRHRQMQRAA